MTLLSDLQAQGLPVVSVTPNFEVTMGNMTPDQQRIYEAVLLHFHYPYDYPDIVDVVKARVELKNNFNDILVQLNDYANVNNASLPELRTQMKYVLNLTIKLMLANNKVLKTTRD